LIVPFYKKIELHSHYCDSPSNNYAKSYSLPVTLVKNHSHYLESDYAEIITVDKSRDWADFKIANLTVKTDIVVSQDYGLAAMVIAKGATCINQNGVIITEKNIDLFLERRHQNQEIRKKHKKYTKFKKREKSNDIAYEEQLIKLIEQKINPGV